MKALLEAFQIFSKYINSNKPISCAADTLYVHVVVAKVSKDDRARLAELGFEPCGDWYFTRGAVGEPAA